MLKMAAKSIIDQKNAILENEQRGQFMQHQQSHKFENLVREHEAFENLLGFRKSCKA
jgi:hypothetical protein